MNSTRKIKNNVTRIRNFFNRKNEPHQVDFSDDFNLPLKHKMNAKDLLEWSRNENSI